MLWQRRRCSGLRRLRRNQRRSLALHFFLPRPLKGCLMSLLDLSQSEIVLAFSRAATEGKFFPVPSLLLDFSGRAVTGDVRIYEI